MELFSNISDTFKKFTSSPKRRASVEYGRSKPKEGRTTVQGPRLPRSRVSNSSLRSSFRGLETPRHVDVDYPKLDAAHPTLEPNIIEVSPEYTDPSPGPITSEPQPEKVVPEYIVDLQIRKESADLRHRYEKKREQVVDLERHCKKLYDARDELQQELSTAENTNRKGRELNSRLKERLEQSDKQIQKLQSEVTRLNDEKRSYIEQLNDVQKSAFERLKPVNSNGKTHDEVSRMFGTLFRDIADWANEFFKHKTASIEEIKAMFACFTHDCVSWGDFNYHKKSSFRFLVEAVISDYISRFIVGNPFIVFPPYTTDLLEELYSVQLAGNYEQALTWRANTFVALDKALDNLEDDSANLVEVRNYQRQLPDAMLAQIMRIFSAFPTEEPSKIDMEKCSEKMLKIIWQALRLAFELAKESSEVVTLGRNEISEFFPDRTFNPKDERFKGRLAQEDDDEGNEFVIRLVLHPCFLKVNKLPVHQESLWIAGKLELDLIKEERGVQEHGKEKEVEQKKDDRQTEEDEDGSGKGDLEKGRELPGDTPQQTLVEEGRKAIHEAEHEGGVPL